MSFNTDYEQGSKAELYVLEKVDTIRKLGRGSKATSKTKSVL